MTPSDTSRPEPIPPDESVIIDQAVFSQIYDQYAPILFGIITATVCDEAEAVRVLESTFKEVRSQFGQFRPESQPLFIWLLSIARRTALEAQKSQTKASPPIFRLTDMGKVTSTSTRVDSTTPVTAAYDAVTPPESELLHAVLFKSCTLDQAASSVGLMVGTARQQLRLAMQQLRTSRTVRAGR